jgi:hypothetical protein
LAAASDPAIIKMLLDSKADVNPKDCVSVFAASATSYQVEAVRLLYEAGASAKNVGVTRENMLCKRSFTEIWLFATRDNGTAEDHETVINLLLKAGMRTRRLFQNSTALSVCFNTYGTPVRSWEAIARMLIADNPGLLDAPDGLRRTPLLLSCCYEPSALIPDNYTREKTLFLLKAGADPRVCDRQGRTALHLLWINYETPRHAPRRVYRNYASNWSLDDAVSGILNAVLTRTTPAIGGIVVDDDDSASDEQARKRQRFEAGRGRR